MMKNFFNHIFSTGHECCPKPLVAFAPRLFSTSRPSLTAFEYIKVEKKGEGDKVAVITLNRPKALNALCDGLMREISKALEELEVDTSVACYILTGKAGVNPAFPLLPRCPIYITFNCP